MARRKQIPHRSGAKKSAPTACDVLRRYRSRTDAVREKRKYLNSSDVLITKLSLKRIVRKVARNVKSSAVLKLLGAADANLVGLSEDTDLDAVHDLPDPIKADLHEVAEANVVGTNLFAVNGQRVSRPITHALPKEIQLDILSRLPIESFRICKSVCELWHRLITQDPIFYLWHYRHASGLLQDSSFDLAYDYGRMRVQSNITLGALIHLDFYNMPIDTSTLKQVEDLNASLIKFNDNYTLDTLPRVETVDGLNQITELIREIKLDVNYGFQSKHTPRSVLFRVRDWARKMLYAAELELGFVEENE